VELDTSVLEDPVDTYIAYKLSTLEQNGSWDPNTLTEISTHIRRRAMNTFLWVALVFKELGTVESYDAIQIIDDIPSGLSELYGHIMTKIKKGQRKDPEYCRKVLTATCLAYRRLSLDELVCLTNFPGKRIEDMESIVRKCGSFLTITRGEVSLIHQSAKDYLLSEVGILPAMPIEAHRELVLSSIKSMSEKLKRDNYGLRHPGFSIDKVQRPDPDPLASIRYACEYWVDHLCGGGNDPSIAMGDLSYQEYFSDKARVHQFLRQHLLHWFEALSLIGKISKGIIGLYTLEKKLTKPPQGNALQHKEFVHDAIRVFRQCRIAVEEAPLQVYYSALIFSAEESVVRRTFQQEIPKEISVRPQVPNNWDPCLQTLECYDGTVRSVAFSPNGQQLAVAVHDGTIRLWDASTGESIRALNSGEEDVSSVAFFPDGQRLVVSGRNRRMRYNYHGFAQFLDANTGELLLDIDGGIAPVALAPDGQRLAYCSRDNALQLCDASTGRHLQTFEGHEARVTSIVFSPNGRQLVSGSDDCAIRLWDTGTSECLRTLEGHTAEVTSVAFSPDQAMASQQLASGSYDMTIRLWDAGTGECLQTLKGHTAEVISVAFSPNRQQITLGSEDSTVPLASGSVDGTVRLWDICTGECVQIFKGYAFLPIPVAFSPDRQQLASAYKHGIVQLWDTSTAKNLHTLEGLKKSPTAIAVSLDGQRLALGLEKGTIQLWDASTMEYPYTLQGHQESVSALEFSRDGQWLASASYDDTVQLWDTSTRECLYAPTIHGRNISVAFSPDGQRLAVGSEPNWSKVQVSLSDTRTKEHLQTLDITEHDSAYSLGFSPDGQRLAVGLATGTIQLRDASTGECLNTLKSDQHRCSTVAFSPDGQLLASADHHNRTVQLWDAGTGEPLQTRHRTYNITPSTNGWNFYPGWGTVDTRQTLESGHIQWIGCGIDPTKVWITWNGKNVLWLPPEYRPEWSFSRDNRVWNGCYSGRVYSLTICAEDTSCSD
jgi:WD40 repeat protein